MTCIEHPNYGAKYKPISKCRECWVRWMNDHPGEALTRTDFEKLGKAFDGTSVREFKRYMRSK